jgi:hypothetical protein
MTNTLLSQGFRQSRLQAVFRKFYGRYNDFVCQYNLPPGKLLSDAFHTNLDCGVYRLPELEIGFTAGVIGRQGYVHLLLLGT